MVFCTHLLATTTMGISTKALIGVFVIASIGYVSCNPSKRHVVLDPAGTTTGTTCIVDPGKENRTINLENAATTWAATLPPMLATLQEMAATMKLERCPPASSPEPRGMDCSMLYAQGHETSGIYQIGYHAPDLSVVDHEPFYAYCDMETDGGGWTVVQKRNDTSTDFNRGWKEYDNGFGHLNGEQWLGLEKMYLLTSYANYELRVDIESATGETAHAIYENVRVGDGIGWHELTLGEYSGTAGDAFAAHDHAHAFSTKDQDNDENANNCAMDGRGGWWHGEECSNGDLNAANMSWGDMDQVTKSSIKVRRT